MRFTNSLKFIGVVLFIILIARTDTDAFTETLRAADRTMLVGALLLFPVIYFLKSLRWHVLIRKAGASVTPMDSLLVYTASLFLGIMTPGKLGELAKIPMLTSRGLSKQLSFILTILDRLIDAAILGLLSIFALGFILNEWAGLISFLILALVILVGIFAHAKVRKSMLVIWNVSKQLQSTFSATLILTLINWIVYFAQMLMIAEAFNISIPIAHFVGIMTLVGLFSLLPIAPAGLGTREAALLMLLKPYAIPSVQILAFSTGISALTILAASVCGSVCLMMLRNQVPK